MTAKIVLFGDDVRERFVSGVNVLANAVKATLGPRGQNVVLEKAWGLPLITKDGVSVAKEIDLPDKIENAAVQLVKSVASKTCDDAGDGTTTATVIAQAILLAGVKAVASGMNPMDLKRGIDKAVTVAVEKLKEISLPCDDKKMLIQVGTISANADKTVADIIAKAMDRVGKDGVITIEDGNGIEDELEVVEGLQFQRGYMSAYFATNRQKMICELDRPYVLLVDKTISTARELLPILEMVAKAGRSILIIAEDMQREALGMLVLNTNKGVIRACVVKAPSFGEHRHEVMEDIAILTGGQVISERAGLSLDNVSLDFLGQCARATISKDTTTLVNGSGDKAKIENRCEEIKTLITETEEEFTKNRLRDRLAKLSGGVAVIKVGGTTETEMLERKARVDDALHACRAAAEEGVVPGGGVALVRCIEPLERLKLDNDDQQMGVKIILHALEAPLRQIVKNAGLEDSVVFNDVKKQINVYAGFNAATLQHGDLLEQGILDPLKVVRSALQNAASIAGLMITTKAVVGKLPDDEELQEKKALQEYARKRRAMQSEDDE